MQVSYAIDFRIGPHKQIKIFLTLQESLQTSSGCVSLQLSENSCARATAGISIPLPSSTPEAIQLTKLPCRNAVLVSTFRPCFLSSEHHGVKRSFGHSLLILTTNIYLQFLQLCSSQYTATKLYSPKISLTHPWELNCKL